MTVRLERVAALGRPVVPLVKINMNGSSSAMAGSGNGTSGAFTSSAKSRGMRITGTPASPSTRQAFLVHEQHGRLGQVDGIAHFRARSTSRSSPR